MALSVNEKSNLKDRYVQLISSFLLFAFASAAISMLSWALQFVPGVGFGAVDFQKNVSALPDMTVARLIFATWCLVGLVALWWQPVWAIFTKIGSFVEDAAISLLGALFGLFLVAFGTTGTAPLLSILGSAVMVIAVSLACRLLPPNEFLRFGYGRCFGTFVALVGLWIGLTEPRLWPWPF